MKRYVINNEFILRRLGGVTALLLALVPNPTVAATQPENACIQCHQGLPDRLGEPVKLWSKSIHAENGIACDSCHGGDAKNPADAMNPARGFLGAPKEPNIPSFCGRCHVGVLRDYLQSAHGRALGKGGPTCVTCHSNHQVLKASLDLINEKSCSRCHTFERARVIKAAMQQTEAKVVSISQRIEGFKAEGVDVENLEKRLFSVRNSFHSLFHEVNVEKVRNESSRINGDLGKLDQSLQVIEKVHEQRRIAGGIVVAGFVAVAVLLYLLRKTYERPRRD